MLEFHSEDVLSTKVEIEGHCYVSQMYKVVVTNVWEYWEHDQGKGRLNVNLYCSENGKWINKDLTACSSFKVMLVGCWSLDGGLFYWYSRNDKIIVFDSNGMKISMTKKRRRYETRMGMAHLRVIQSPDDYSPTNYWESLPDFRHSS
ncbi:hypothetical protein AKJ16_DCAP01629 [Drosera capensis]